MDDMSNLKKLGISLEKFISYENAKSIKTMNSYSKDAIESIFKYQEQQQKIKEEEELADPSEEKKEESQIDSCRSYLTSVFTRSSDFEDEDSNTDFYKELGKFTSYIESKARRDIDSCLINLNLDLLKKYNAEYLFIIEEIIIEYFSFFFAHLPSKMFHLSTRL
ncbi:hypothetical protein [Clostridium sp.]|uniref:hypothetical protein n=1 Tax=Clostridium sp. TaxID=1506 RepID=UPI003F4C10F9